MTNIIFFPNSRQPVEKPMGLEYHASAAVIYNLAELESYIEKFIFPSLLCIVIHSQMIENRAKGEYAIRHISICY
jgi:hypothetical protein